MPSSGQTPPKPFAELALLLTPALAQTGHCIVTREQVNHGPHRDLYEESLAIKTTRAHSPTALARQHVNALLTQGVDVWVAR